MLSNAVRSAALALSLPLVGGAALDQARDFSRLFMIPGMDHCCVFTNGPGIADTGVDLLTALEAWVEKGAVPNELLATKADDKGRTLGSVRFAPGPKWPSIEAATPVLL